MHNAHTILVTGGAGYIGSAVGLYLLQQGYQVVVVDKKVKPDFFKTPNFSNLIYYQSDFADQNILSQIFTKFSVSAVMHFAAFIEVGESVKDPAKYYENNVIKTVQLLDTMRQYGVRKFVFSSSCAIYGLPAYTPIDEVHLKNPISPYGKTKLIIEQVLEDYARAYNFKYCALRYFNAAGAWPEFDLGERHEPETHVIPLLLNSAFTGTVFTVFGNSYATTDGTCIRDYLHIRDLADAHYKAVNYLELGSESTAFNLGTGRGYSILELIKTVEKITGLPVNFKFAQRRMGDPERLVAQANLAQEILGWYPQFSSLENIIETAYKFYVGNQNTQHDICSDLKSIEHN